MARKKIPSFLQNYRFTFDWKALVAFALVMLPNLIWACLGRTDDILHYASSYPWINITARVFQAIALPLFVFVENKEAGKIGFSTPVILSIVAIGIYYVAWIAYFLEYGNAAVLISLSVFGGGSLLIYSLDRKNYLAATAWGIFLAFHLATTVVDYLLVL